MKVGVVLGAGGLVGSAWLAGGLQALSDEAGYDVARADYLVGTSAGSFVAAFAASRRPFSALGRANGRRGRARTPGGGATAPAETVASAADRSPLWPPDEFMQLSPFRLHRGLPRPGLGSWSLAFATIAQPWRHTPAALYSAWLPDGLFSTDGLADLISREVPEGFAVHPNLWMVACDHGTGRRVAFGREGAPPAELSKAVAASCAIPGTYRSVKIGGRRYVDGGMYSTSNLDLLRHAEVDLAICLNPTSTTQAPPASGPLDRLANGVRRESGRRLGREARKLRAGGTEVVLVQPGLEDLVAMGTNLMSPSVGRRQAVFEIARRTVAEQLRSPEVSEMLRDLPREPKAKPRRSSRPAASATDARETRTARAR